MFPGRTDPVLGRTRELDDIESSIARDQSGARALLIEGEAGIGKTTLWHEALGICSRSTLVLTSRASQAETRLSFAVLGDLLQPIYDRTLLDLPDAQRHSIEAALLLETPSPGRPDARAVGMAVLGVLRSLAGEGGLTMGIDDIQWTDGPSARALAFALRRLSSESVLVVATRRRGAGVGDPLRLEELPSGVHKLTVGPLSAVALGRLLRLHNEHEVPPPLARRIHEASGGNPFVAIQIDRALGQEGREVRPGEPLPVPLDLEGLLRDRLDTVSASAQEALLLAACAARPTRALVLAAGGDEDALEEAEIAGIITLDDALAFVHPLYASAIYGRATSRARREAHAGIASAVDDPEEHARHLALSAERPDESIAQALDRAAARAESIGAPDAAAELLLLASQATPPGSIEAWRRRQQGALGNLAMAGDVPGARELNRRLIEALEPGPGRAFAKYTLAIDSWIDVPRVTSLLRDALEEVGDDDETRALLIAELAWAMFWACEPAKAIPRADEAISLLRDEDVTVVRSALSVRAMAGYVLGEDTTALLERAMAFAGPLDYGDLSTPAQCLGRLRTWTGDLDGARDVLQGELERAVGQGHETLQWQIQADLAEVEWRAGRWLAGAEHTRVAVEIVTDTGLQDVLGYVLPVGAMIGCALGSVDKARVDAEEALSTCLRLGDRWDELRARAALGFLELSLGDLAACAAVLAPLAELTERMGLGEPGVVPFVPDAIEALVALGDLDEASRLTERLEEQGRALGRSFALAAAARCRSLIAGARGEFDEALDHVDRAIEAHVLTSKPFELGRTLLVAGTVERRMKRKRPARERLEQARRIFDDLGGPLWSAKAAVEIARIGGRPAATGKLTETERRVTQLAAVGSTNREIADRLFISVKTVEANLSRAYGKLGIQSRRDLRGVLEPLGDAGEQS